MIVTEIKKRPMLFSTSMVKAEKDGLKTRTRRIINPLTPEAFTLMINLESGIRVEEMKSELIRCDCPYGKVGDILWVREEHYRYGHWIPVPDVKTKTGRQKWMFIEESDEARYFDNPPETFKGGRRHSDPPMTSGWYKRLGRFMPYSACRTFLKITDIRVERLQDISYQDAIDEGIASFEVAADGGLVTVYKDYSGEAEWVLCPIQSFRTLWESINGFGSWKRNDWVWVISFERTSKP